MAGAEEEPIQVDNTSTLIEILTEEFSTFPRSTIEDVVKGAEGNYENAYSYMLSMIVDMHEIRDRDEELARELAEAEAAADDRERGVVGSFSDDSLFQTLKSESDRDRAQGNRRGKKKNGLKLSFSELDEHVSVNPKNKWRESESLSNKLKVKDLQSVFAGKVSPAEVEDIFNNCYGDVERAELQVRAIYFGNLDDDKALLDSKNGLSGSNNGGLSMGTSVSSNTLGNEDSEEKSSVLPTVVSSVGTVNNSGKLKKAWEELDEIHSKYLSHHILGESTRSSAAIKDSDKYKRKYDEMFEKYLDLLASDSWFRSSSAVDLHGFSAECAVLVCNLKIEIEEKSVETYVGRREIHFITGRGKTTNGRVKIRPAVEKLLREKGYNPAHDNQRGVVTIRIG